MRVSGGQQRGSATHAHVNRTYLFLLLVSGLAGGALSEAVDHIQVCSTVSHPPWPTGHVELAFLLANGRSARAKSKHKGALKASVIPHPLKFHCLQPSISEAVMDTPSQVFAEE